MDGALFEEGCATIREVWVTHYLRAGPAALAETGNWKKLAVCWRRASGDGLVSTHIAQNVTHLGPLAAPTIDFGPGHPTLSAKKVSLM